MTLRDTRRWFEAREAERNHLAGYITSAVTRAFKEDDPPWLLLGHVPGGLRLRGEYGTYVVTIMPKLDRLDQEGGE